MEPTHRLDHAKRFGILLGGTGLLLLGIAAMIFVLRGPPMSAQDRLIERMADEVYIPALTKDRREKEDDVDNDTPAP